jgi:hypothetical protein
MKAANQGPMTIHTMVFETAPLVMHLAMGPGPATDYPLKRIALSELFDRRLPSPARERGAGREGTSTGGKPPTDKSAAPGKSKPVRRVAGVDRSPDGSSVQTGASASDYDKIERRLVFCCRGQFLGPVQVPQEAGLGKAKVTFSLEKWTEGRVRPNTTEFPVVDSEVQGHD